MDQKLCRCRCKSEGFQLYCTCECHRGPIGEVFYNWLHIPTGKRGQSSMKFDVLIAIERVKSLAEALNKWNGQQPGVWQYWS